LEFASADWVWVAAEELPSADIAPTAAPIAILFQAIVWRITFPFIFCLLSGRNSLPS
jgi:hypothetical protein